MDGHLRAAVTELFPEAGGVATGPPVYLSDAVNDAVIQDAAAGPSGRFAVTWFDLSDGRGSPSLAELAHERAPTVTAQLGTERAVLGTRVAYDPATGRPTVTWSEGGYPQGYRVLSWTAPALP